MTAVTCRPSDQARSPYWRRRRSRSHSRWAPARPAASLSEALRRLRKRHRQVRLRPTPPRHPSRSRRRRSARPHHRPPPVRAPASSRPHPRLSPSAHKETPRPPHLSRPNPHPLRRPSQLLHGSSPARNRPEAWAPGRRRARTRRARPRHRHIGLRTTREPPAHSGCSHVACALLLTGLLSLAASISRSVSATGSSNWHPR